MAEKQQIGISWGANQLYIVVMNAVEIIKSFTIPLPEDKIGHPERNIVPSAMQLISNIQKKLGEEDILKASINLALPLKDIIFRSFVIPRMQTSEIKSAVDFEASKYVPFALKDLAYAFQPITITEDKIKRIRIIFAAIKKDSLNQYTDVLEQTELEAMIVEPEASSLIRALSYQKILHPNKAIALVEKDGDIGKIIVIEKEIPQFVREFPLKINTPEEGLSDENTLTPRLINEIKISLDYFNRQNNRLQVEQVLLLSNSVESNLIQQIEENMGIPIKLIQPSAITGDENHNNFGYIKAFGTGLINTLGSQVYFDFLQKKAKTIKITSHRTAESAVNLRAAGITVVICCLLLTAVFFLSKQLMLADYEKNIAELKMQLGSKADVTLKSVEDDIHKTQTKYETFQNVRLTSNISSLLIRIPELLPNGAWLQDISISFTDTALSKARSSKPKKKSDSRIKHVPTVHLSGYVYSNQFNRQFELVNQLMRNLKEDISLSEQFKHIDLEAVDARKLGSYPVTSYRITLK